MIVLTLLVVLLPAGTAMPEPEVQESIPSLDLLEYIGSMEQTNEGELLDPMGIPVAAPMPASDKPQPYADKAFPEQ